MCNALNQSLCTSAAVPFPLCFKANLCPFVFQNWSNCVQRNCLTFAHLVSDIHSRIWMKGKDSTSHRNWNALVQQYHFVCTTLQKRFLICCLYGNKLFYFRWKLVCARAHISCQIIPVLWCCEFSSHFLRSKQEDTIEIQLTFSIRAVRVPGIDLMPSTIVLGATHFKDWENRLTWMATQLFDK